MTRKTPLFVLFSTAVVGTLLTTPAAVSACDFRYAGYGLLAFLAVTLAACCVPRLLSRGLWCGRPACTPVLGHTATRRRLFTRTVAAFLIPLMAVGPETVAALNQEALLYNAGIGVALWQTSPIVTVTNYAYDANGNLIEKAERFGPVTRYTYDAENRLVKVDPDMGPTAVTTYAYDADGIRIAKTVGTERTTYLVDKNRDYAQVLEERM